MVSEKKYQLSEIYRFKVKTSQHRSFELARYGGLSPSHFSALLNHAARVRTGVSALRQIVALLPNCR